MISVIVRVALAASIMAALAFITYGGLNEAFGSGPPHYGRTTNMDKWENPVPMLLAFNAFGGFLAILILRSALRKFRLVRNHARSLREGVQ